jgi:hypothetical protein
MALTKREAKHRTGVTSEKTSLKRNKGKEPKALSKHATRPPPASPPVEGMGLSHVPPANAIPQNKLIVVYDKLEDVKDWHEKVDKQALGVSSIEILPIEELDSKLSEIIQKNEMNAPTFILTTRSPHTIKVVKNSHIPSACIPPGTPFPKNAEELGVWHIQALAWSQLKAMCNAFFIPFFLEGNAGKGFTVIGDALLKEEAADSPQLLVYLFPFAFSLLHIESNRSLFKLMNKLLEDWTWLITPEKIDTLTYKPRELLYHVCVQSEDSIVAGALLDSKGRDTEHANAWKNGCINVVDELIHLISDIEETMRITVSLNTKPQNPESLIDGNDDPTWADVTQYYIDNTVNASFQDPMDKRDYEGNMRGIMYVREIILLFYMLERFHDREFDPEELAIESNARVPTDFAQLIKSHMKQTWKLCCIVPPAVVSIYKKKGEKPPPGLFDCVEAPDMSKKAKMLAEEKEAAADADDEDMSEDSEDEDFDLRKAIKEEKKKKTESQSKRKATPHKMESSENDEGDSEELGSEDTEDSEDSEEDENESEDESASEDEDDDEPKSKKRKAKAKVEKPKKKKAKAPASPPPPASAVSKDKSQKQKWMWAQLFNKK